VWRHLGQNVREAGEAADEPFDAALFYLGAVVNGERRSAWICMQVTAISDWYQSVGVSG
jgi:hypothetical protein